MLRGQDGVLDANGLVALHPVGDVEADRVEEVGVGAVEAGIPVVLVAGRVAALGLRAGRGLGSRFAASPAHLTLGQKWPC
jgi:hypothetical protein